MCCPLFATNSCPFLGIDIAFVKWGHVYHTRYDHTDMVKTGVIQNAGNMLLALVPEAADNTALESKVNSILVNAVIQMLNNLIESFLII